MSPRPAQGLPKKPSVLRPSHDFLHAGRRVFSISNHRITFEEAVKLVEMTKKETKLATIGIVAPGEPCVPLDNTAKSARRLEED